LKVQSAPGPCSQAALSDAVVAMNNAPKFAKLNIANYGEVSGRYFTAY
jgi:hypothetical protein